MSGSCRHSHPNADGDCWCSLTWENDIEERRLCHKCKSREEAKCIKRPIIGHARSVDLISIRVKNVIAERV